MYFRLEPNQVFHKRIEYSFSQLLGDVGGTAELLLRIICFLMGGYLSFHSNIEIMKGMYSHTHALKKMHTRVKSTRFEGGNMELPVSNFNQGDS